jgi:tetratricopeptide (TPR) repeat protein
MFKSSPVRKNVLVLALLLLLVAGVFGPSLSNGFLNWDDDVYVTSNLGVKDFSVQKLPRIFTSFERQQYKPLSFLCFSIEYRLFGLRPAGYHAVSLALHLFNVALVFWLFFLLRRSLLIALVVAVLFGVHPLRVESVAWITEQKDLLYGFFFLWASVCYLQYMIKGQKVCYYASLGFFVCSLFSKPMLLGFPFILLGYDAFCREKRFFVQPAYEKIPFFLISFLVAVLNVLAISWHSPNHVLAFSVFEWVSRLNFYVYKIFWPMHLSGFYPYIPQESHSFFSIATAVFSLFCWALFFWIFRKNKKFVFGVSFFILSVFPVLLEHGAFVVADRYVYIAALGFFYLAGEGFARAWGVRESAGRVIRVFSVVLCVVVIGSMCFSTFQRAKVWHDSLCFWEDVLKKHPDSFLARNNRGDAYLGIGQYESAIADFNASLKIDPSQSATYVNLCNAHIFLGKQEQALVFCNKAIALDPQNAVAYFNIGNIYADLGKHDQAILAYNRAVAIKKDYADAYQNLGTVYNAMGRTEEAERLFRKALEIDGSSLEARYNLAVLYFLGKRHDLAIKYCDEAIKLGYQPDKDFLEVLRPFRNNN